MANFDNTKIVRSNRATMALQILEDSTLIVKAPNFLSLPQIEKFIKLHWDWVEKKRANLPVHKVTLKNYTDGEKFVYLGKEYSLKLGNFTKISVDDLYINFPKAAQFRASKELSMWYQHQAQEIITNQIEHFSKIMEVKYTSISFSDTKSKWGSCTHDNRLQFNWRLIMAPLIVINYVVIHELSHIKEKNHSRAFWNIVRHNNPSYKQQIKWLNTFGNSLKF